MLADLIALSCSLAEIEPRTGRKAPSVVTTADRVRREGLLQFQGRGLAPISDGRGKEFAPCRNCE